MLRKPGNRLGSRAKERRRKRKSLEWTCRAWSMVDITTRAASIGHRRRRTRKESSMRTLFFSNLVVETLVLTLLASAPASLAVAHEDHKMECSETGMNAMRADIQSMTDGEAKTTAMKEMKMAEDMMAEKDMKACATHMHNAMEA